MDFSRGSQKDFLGKSVKWTFFRSNKMFFVGGTKSMKFHFSHSKRRKQPFC